MVYESYFHVQLFSFAIIKVDPTKNLLSASENPYKYSIPTNPNLLPVAVNGTYNSLTLPY